MSGPEDLEIETNSLERPMIPSIPSYKKSLINHYYIALLVHIGDELEVLCPKIRRVLDKTQAITSYEATHI